MNKEDKLDIELKNPTHNSSSAIEHAIDDCLKNHNNVYCMTDWHLWIRKEKGKPECHERKEFNTIINNIKNTIKDDDILIVLGDLVDGEFKEKNKLKEVIQQLPGIKILTIGNNDLFTKDFYKECGFKYVTESFVWHNIVFSHMPIKNNNDMNIHGHIHNSKTYWVPYKNHIDVAYLEGRIKPVKLNKIISTQKSYSKVIKESPSHFDEGYNIIDNGLFININESYIPDPFE